MKSKSRTGTATGSKSTASRTGIKAAGSKGKGTAARASSKSKVSRTVVKAAGSKRTSAASPAKTAAKTAPATTKKSASHRGAKAAKPQPGAARGGGLRVGKALPPATETAGAASTAGGWTPEMPDTSFRQTTAYPEAPPRYEEHSDEHREPLGRGAPAKSAKAGKAKG